MGLLPEEVGVHVVKTVFKKSPAEAAVALWADKRQEVAALRARFSLCRHLQDCRGELERFIFEVEKLRKGIKDLNNCWERGSKSKIQTITDEFVAAVIARYTLKSNGSSLTPSRCCFGRMLPWISAIYPDWNKIFQQDDTLVLAAISLAGKSLRTGKMLFCRRIHDP
jgi:hypothetical protein